MMTKVIIFVLFILFSLIDSHVIVSNADSFDVLSNVSKFQSLSCSSSYSDLTQCSVTTTCFPTTCANQYGVKCNGKLAK